ncbi:hypothetical protein BDZ97DRAFT_1917421 [Flammula alnicola]|nr:hypothetical protein BDZ97DRAFT_1917421 [Flammula alnicola]
MEPTGIVTLPQEILDLVVDMVAKFASRRTMQSCSSICRSFCRRARYHLFSTIFIFSPNEATARRLSTLDKLIEEDSGPLTALASYITSFTLCMTNRQEVKQLLDNGSLAAIMRRLQSPTYGVEVFKLEIAADASASWDELSDDFRASFRLLCRSPYLKNLTIEGICSMPRTLFHETSLEHLSIARGDSDFQDDELFTPYEANSTRNMDIVEFPPRLQFFDTDNTFLFPRASALKTDSLAGSRSPFISLKNLAISVNVGALGKLNAIWDIFATASASLEVLELRCTRDRSTPPNLIGLQHFVFNMARLQRLTSLTICIWDPKSLTLETDMDDIVLVLSHFYPPATLQTITLDVRLFILDPKEILLHTKTTQWISIDQVLSGSSFLSVPRIIISLHPNILNRGNDALDTTICNDTILELLRPLFPTLSRAGGRFVLEVNSYVF